MPDTPWAPSHVSYSYQRCACVSTPVRDICWTCWSVSVGEGNRKTYIPFLYYIVLFSRYPAFIRIHIYTLPLRYWSTYICSFWILYYLFHLYIIASRSIYNIYIWIINTISYFCYTSSLYHNLKLNWRHFPTESWSSCPDISCRLMDIWSFRHQRTGVAQSSERTVALARWCAGWTVPPSIQRQPCLHIAFLDLKHIMRQWKSSRVLSREPRSY